MRRAAYGAILLVGALATAPSIHSQNQVLDPPIPHDRGQSVSPSFEGWYKNADGTYTLSFGYLNRNFKEQPDIPIGPNNKFSPGPEDRGQPTHFMPRRVFGAFAVVVPKDFANDKNNRLTWTITVHGQTVSIPGHLRPEWEIDALKEATSGNRPPVLKFASTGPEGHGPLGVAGTMTATVGRPAPLEIHVSDDMVRKPEAQGRQGGPQLGVAWTKFRGPGTVSFGADVPKIEGGKASTTVTFGAPGQYVLRAHAWDDSGRYAVGFQCCWTNGFMKVDVAPAK
jgi:hypothetical protein